MMESHDLVLSDVSLHDESSCFMQRDPCDCNHPLSAAFQGGNQTRCTCVSSVYELIAPSSRQSMAEALSVIMAPLNVGSATETPLSSISFHSLTNCSIGQSHSSLQQMQNISMSPPQDEDSGQHQLSHTSRLCASVLPLLDDFHNSIMSSEHHSLGALPSISTVQHRTNSSLLRSDLMDLTTAYIPANTYSNYTNLQPLECHKPTKTLNLTKPTLTQSHEIAIPKRKRVVLTLESKLAILSRLDNGESVSKLAREFNVSKSTISDMKHSKQRLKDFADKLDSADGVKKLKVMRTAQDERLDKAVYVWYLQERSRGTKMTGPVLIEKAKLFHNLLYGGQGEFKASSGWLSRFKLRHDIKLPNPDVPADLPETHINAFQQNIEKLVGAFELTREQVYSCNETALFWKLLPKKTLAGSSTKMEEANNCPGTKQMSNERITLLACSNASGKHRFPLFVVGKAKMPRCFKYINLESLPVRYISQNNATMDVTIFREWFFSVFVPEVKLHLQRQGMPSRAVLLLDATPSHPDCDELQSEDGSIRTIFLLPNTNFITHPLEQGVMQALKRLYRHKLLSKIVADQGQIAEPFIEVLKRVTLKDAVYMVSEAWVEITEDIISKAWVKVWPMTNSLVQGTRANVKNEGHSLHESRNDPKVITNANLGSEESTVEAIQVLLQELPGGETVNTNDVINWLRSDTTVQMAQMSDQDIIRAVVTETAEQDKAKKNTQDEDGGAIESVQVPSNEEAAECLTKALCWLESQPDTEQSEVALLQKVLLRAQQRSEVKQFKTKLRKGQPRKRILQRKKNTIDTGNRAQES